MAHTTLREYLQNTEDAISSGRIDDAMANCQHILSYFPDALEAQRLLGEVYLAQGQLEEAQQTFDWILANDPENVIAYCNRALTSERMSDIDTALDCYQQAYELSRGNSQIRQQFNQLSAKVGQQEFMFSRAGLARLYMRGDLLTQAVQEWEAVLNASPERLDARTGLLETYWREGIYDKAEQLATQILEEIPTCLKALLLLAHVTSTYKPERAKELVQRAEALDPELVMAQELFSDLIAGQPNDPFLASLKREPAIFADSSDEKQASKTQAAINTSAVSNGSHSSAESSNQPYGWTNLESWSEVETNHVSLNAAKPEPEAPALASWSDVSNMRNVDSRAAIGQAGQAQIEPESGAWKTSLEIDDDFDPAILEQQPWFRADQQNISPSKAEQAIEKPGAIGSTELHSWSAATLDDDLPSPPAWLDMLTKKDRQPSGSVPTISTQPSSIQVPLDNAFLTQSRVEPEPTSSKRWGEDLSAIPASPTHEEEPAFFFPSDENDSDMSWPEWLKSLGAETMERDPESVAEPVTPELQQPLTFQAWSDHIDQALSEADAERLATLEHLEKDLLSQGFVPLQPGTLSTLAQEPSLSSALAQLGDFSSQLAISEPAVDPAQPVTPIQPVESTSYVEPTAPLPLPSEQVQARELEPWWGVTPDQGSKTEMPAGLVAQQPIYPGSATSSAPPAMESDHTEAAPDQVLEPVANPVANLSQETPLMPVYRADALLENELETTMKRPAIKLQPMQQSAAQMDVSNMLGRGRHGERGAGARALDENLSNKERLLRGYQFQLAGDYDDAMQEYRIIIRNAPELLSEVISNVRALLKLTPRYAVGYRVLGDAYMRQGEYLQAMEAYNKALTIAKKAKSQGN
jgi:tetratricopeptide (TPR) repeat protein